MNALFLDCATPKAPASKIPNRTYEHAADKVTTFDAEAGAPPFRKKRQGYNIYMELKKCHSTRTNREGKCEAEAPGIPSPGVMLVSV
jgi:hypothetical protein